MKKTYTYFVVPLVLTAIFAVFYYRYASVYEEREAAHKAEVRKQRDDKLKEEARQRQKAIDEAVAATEKRKKEKADRDAKLAAEREAREQAAQERNKAREDSRKFAEQVRRLQKEVEEAKGTITDIEASHKMLRDEEAFLRDYVKKAEANTQALTGVLERIEAADKARAEAARQAAAAAKKS